MKGSLRLNKHKPSIILHSSQLISTNHTRNKTPISHTTNRTSTHHNSHIRREGVVENSEKEVEEVDLVEEEAKLLAITVENWVTMPDISYNLRRHVHTVRDRTIMSNNVLN